MMDYQRIKKDCFWDMDISDKDIDSIIKNDDFREKMFLVEKILLNSTKLFEDLRLFDLDQLKILLGSYQVSGFNKDYIFRRKNMAEVYFFDEHLLVDELKWIA